MKLIIWGLIFDIIGASILVLVTLFDPFHQRIFGEDKWWRRYWWNGWRPIYKDRKTHKLKIKFNHRPTVYWILPPKHIWNAIGLIFILVGFYLQLKSYLF